MRRALADIRDGVRSAPGRWVVMGLAIALGSGSLVVLLSAIGGLQREARGMVEGFGVNMFAILREGAGARLGEEGAGE